MSGLIALYLPILGAALIVAMVGTWIARFFTMRPRVQQACFWGLLFICLVPYDGMTISHFTRVLTGDLSPAGLAWLLLTAFDRLHGPGWINRAVQIHVSFTIVLVAAVLYPTALGLTDFDLYASGYQPILLGPLVLALFCFCIWFRFVLPATMLAAGFLGYALGLLESDNLWDYLLDPVVSVYAIVLLLGFRRHLPAWRFSPQHIETGMIFFILSFLLFAVFLARFDHDAFQFRFVVEDGFVEWSTVIVLVVTMTVCGSRVFQLRQRRSIVFLGATGLLTLLCLFGAGEELSSPAPGPEDSTPRSCSGSRNRAPRGSRVFRRIPQRSPRRLTIHGRA